MESLIIPGWALAVGSGLGTLLIGWLVWLTIKTNENEKYIAVNTANDKNVAAELEKIYKSIERIDGKLDTIMANELAFFKDQFTKK